MDSDAAMAPRLDSLEIRQVRPDEYEAAGEVVVAAYEALDGDSATGGYADELRDVAHRVTGSEVIVAVHGGQVIGCVTFVPDTASPWAEGLEEGESAVRMLGVHPQSQRLGAGKALLDACVSRAVARGSQYLFLHSTPWMTTAQKMYTRAGFVRVPERDWLPVPEVPLLAFRLALAAD
ncbi:MAG: GNAT family N-acetyltransferase [Acidimicrobiales bacterium]